MYDFIMKGIVELCSSLFLYIVLFQYGILLNT